MADGEPITRGFIPGKRKPGDNPTRLKKLPEQPPRGDLRTDITSAATTGVPPVISMFSRVAKAAAPGVVKPPPPPPAPKPSVPRPAPPPPPPPKPAAVAEEVAEEEAEAPAVVPAGPIIRRVVKKSKPAPAPVADADEIPPELVALQSAIASDESMNPYQDPVPTAYYPEDRKGFYVYINNYYSHFKLPKIINKRINPKACSEMKLQTYKYQEFVREYMRQASPYRGVLVYHGLGSGKTCTSIATAEALYGQGKRKIIVMTPISLQENFINEIMFCGFKHFRLKNFWVPFTFEDPAVRLFAEKVVGIPVAHLNSLIRKSKGQQVFWMPDMTKTDKEVEDQQKAYEGEWQQSAIREQLYAIIKNKITFIGYTGYTYARLMDIAVNNPTFFDNAVIVIDEIHNLTRLMAGKIDKFLVNKPTSKAGKVQKDSDNFSPISADTRELKLKNSKGVDIKYSRAFLFYRLLVQAKNSKIIALSGTPIVNTPVEVGILANMLHGYFHCCNVNLKTTDDATLKKVLQLLINHRRVNYYTIQKAQGSSKLFFTILNEGYIKKFDTTGALNGIIYVGPDTATPGTIQELYTDIEGELAKINVIKATDPSFVALPLLPPTYDEFQDTFVDTTNLKIKNEIVFAKRVSGLISYYRGSKEELMPKVVRDEVVICPFSTLALPQYTAARKKEIEEKPKKTPIGEEALSEKESTSYRFRSRALCNFAFPTDIERPFPVTTQEYIEAAEASETLFGDGVTDLAGDAVAVEAAEAAEAAAEREDADAVEAPVPAPAAVARVLPYKERIDLAIAELKARAPVIFGIDPTKPEEQQLKTYSNKFAQIYERILASKGTSLVYSQFKTLEGIGIFSIALDVNGFAPIRLTGSEKDLELAPETIASIREHPEQPRYILYSGGESIRIRQTLINIFNMRIDKLPKKIADVLMGSEALLRSRNMKGEVCRVFMITGAGAEGLSLRNVRTVHIMEPFWNKVRTDQVKGRAVRICSHSDLEYDTDPAKNERTVEIFTYLSIFAPGQKIDQTIIINDTSTINKGHVNTTDEHIYQLADLKDKVNSDFLTGLKRGAVDCVLNKSENEQYTCYAFEGSLKDFLYDPRILEDIEMTRQQVVAAPAAPAPAPAPAAAPAAPAAPVAPEKPKYKTYKLKDGLEYYAVPSGKGDDKEILYLVTDELQKNPKGETRRDPVTQKRKAFLTVKAAE
jgi:hypothetical protein